MQPELARLRELAETRPEAEEAVAGDAGGEVGQGLAHVVDAVLLDAEEVAVGCFGVGIGARFREEIVEGAAGVVGQLFEERFCFGVCKRTHVGVVIGDTPVFVRACVRACVSCYRRIN